ncbi:transglutaminase domain-containing protein [Foetidibacter luteolus]|uniref:transglutaminase domain-containing protein n=1 Tax=Foetidibacter luteolus TaxID=2608880 RepID=UPI00129A411C|nr:transglutaminase domain-containing protein [Foetidibacter luteolus]
MKTFGTLWILMAAVVAWPARASAQTIEELAAKYPNNYAVFLNYNRDTRIFLKDNVPQAETKEYIEIAVLDDKANGLYNKYKVFHGSFDELKELEAYTRYPDGNRYKKINVPEIKTQSSRSSGVFYDDVKESAFDFSSLVKGAYAVVNSTEYNKDPHLLSPFYFASYLPVVNAKFTISFPSDMEIKYNIRNDGQQKIKVKEDNKGREHSYEFTANDVKHLDRFGDAPSMSYYEPHVIVQIASYKNDNGENVNYLRNLDDLYQWNYAFIKNLDNTKGETIKHLADSLTAGITTPKEKAKRIYQWVQQHIKYVAFEDGLEGFVPRKAEAVCTRRYGDCKDMASLLTAMMQLAGLDAHFTWIGTRHIPYDYTEVSLPITDNHMISAVKIGSEWIFLDGTDPGCIFGLPSNAIQGKQALIAINEKEYKVERVPVIESDKNAVVDSTFISIADNGIKGRSSVYYQGYFATDINNGLMYRDARDTRDFVKSRMGKASNKFILGDYTINNKQEDKSLVNIQADFHVPDYGKKVADELYINLNLEKFFASSVIDTAKRKVAMENDYHYVITQYTILDVPETYKVNYLPKNFNLKNDAVSFDIQYSVQGNKIIAKQEIRNNFLLMQPKDFATWNSAIKELQNQYKEQVVITKSN